MIQFGRLCPLRFAPLQLADGEPITPERANASTVSAPQHRRSPKQAFLPLEEGKRRAKCHFWALGQVSVDAEPQSHSELTNSAPGWSSDPVHTCITTWEGPQTARLLTTRLTHRRQKRGPQNLTEGDCLRRH